MTRVLLASMLASLVVACGSSTPPPVSPSTETLHAGVPASKPEISGDEAKQLVKGGAKLVDVRTPEEYAQAHIEGAVNVPVDQIGTADMGPKDGKIVVYCQAGGRSSRAAETLRGKGYTNVESMGAMSKWAK